MSYVVSRFSREVSRNKLSGTVVSNQRKEHGVTFALVKAYEVLVLGKLARSSIRHCSDLLLSDYHIGARIGNHKTQACLANSLTPLLVYVVPRPICISSL